MRRRAGHRIAAESRNGIALHTVGDFRGCDSGADGNAIGHPFGKSHDIGFDTPMLDAKHLATRSAPGRLHLVADEKAAVFFDDADNLFEILLRGRDKTSDPLYGFGQKSSDPPLRCRRLNRLFDVLGAFQVAAWISEPERATVAISVGNMMHAGNNIRHQPP